MRKARFIEHQIFAVLKSVKDVCREVGISEACDIKNMKDLENVNRRLKPMFVDLSLECRH
ncbi:putative transposase [Pantoea ananatis]|nr:Low calcium response locus protein S [Pantoea ananatis]SKA74507.1 putative transposase [Pantoea ananatis]